MKTNHIRISLRKAKANLEELCNAAASNRHVVIIERPDGSDVALVAANELSALIETLYLLRSQKNAARLLTALKRAQRQRRDKVQALSPDLDSTLVKLNRSFRYD